MPQIMQNSGPFALEIGMQHRSLTDARLAKKPMASINEAVIGPRLSGPNGELAILPTFIQVDMAHIAMLTICDIIPRERGVPVLQALRALRDEGAAALNVDPAYGTLLLQVERFLASRAGGEAGGMLQLARSRVDQGATIGRIAVRDLILVTIEQVIALQATIVHRAEEWQGIIMPGYTHIQHSQPWVLAHYALAYCDAFQRDLERLWECFTRVNRSPLGTAAMAGTGWPIDRKMTARFLGFDSVIRNAKDANFVTGMDFIPEVAATLSLLMAGLGRWASEFYVWSSWEFGLVELDEGLCGTSSLMPQKKNAYALERIRALSGEALGWLPAQLGLLRSPTSTDCDVNFSSREHFGYFQTAGWALRLMTDVVSTVRVNAPLMAERAGANWTTASELADTIVRHSGLDFRQAHHIVGALVRDSLARNIDPRQIRAAELDRAAAEIIGRPLGLPDEIVARALDPEDFVASRRSAGSVNATEVSRLLELANVDIGVSQARLETCKASLASSARHLEDSIDSLLLG